ncbi:VanZ family protein [Streptomyces sp. A5-4]|uniref:VanZ family protein n=1 Tax=Streptomyces sp. A5-4 TaxID=3384771 RepID=UPI003DA93FE9
MFSAIFQDRFGFLAAATAAALVIAFGAYKVAHRKGQRPYAYAGLAAVLTSEAAVTLFMPGGGYTSRNCVINHNVAEPFSTTQGLLNLAMFLPIGFLGVVALRAVVPVIAGAATLSLLTEIAQTLVPGIGRGCDSSDFLMNSLGGALGALAAWAYLRASKHKVDPRAHMRTTTIACGGVLALAAIAGATWITPQHLDSTSLQLAGSTEKQAAQKAMDNAFGARYTVADVQVQPPWENSPGSLLIELADKKGNASLTWPDARELTVSFENSDKTTSASFPVPGADKKPANADDAYAIAQTYARRYFPAALSKSKHFADPVGDQAELGWMVSWRRKNADGVLMPLRLDVQINTAGRISQLLTANAEDPEGLPKPRISKATAETTALKSITAEVKGIKLKVANSSLMAVEISGEWRPEWSVTFEDPQGETFLTATYVDAVTGKAENR